MHRKVAVAIAAALALTVASCGGSGTTTLNRAELVRRVEVACRDAQTAATRKARAGGRTPDPVAALQAGQKALVERLEDLNASGAAKADFADYKAGLNDRLDAINKVLAASRADRSKAIRSVEAEATAAGRKMEAAARRLGLHSCG
jgi:hypothetical protein